MIDEYLNFDLRLFAHEASADGAECFRVQVAASPIGEQPAPETVTLPALLRARLVELERRGLDAAQMVEVGQAVAALMLPPTARSYFLSSLARLQPSQGLRLRLRCEAISLDSVPWEIAHLDRGLNGAQAATDRRGYLVLDTRLSLVRRELCSQLINPARRQGGKRRLVALLCEPADRRNEASPLQVELELEQLRDAVQGVESFELVHCAQATRRALSELLLDGGADIFHFAGHGEMRPGASGDSRAYLLLQRDDGMSDEWAADELALRLANKGIQLAMLGACRSAQRDGRNSWAGIAPSLARAGVPAVIGMQYTVYDLSAVAFSRCLYRALPRVRWLDEAVAEARLAILDIAADTGRDFATPVFYLREDEGIAGLFGPAIDPTRRVVPARAVSALPESDDLTPLLRLLDEVHDYKRVHDALHTTRVCEFNLIVLRRDAFPGGSTLREFGTYANVLKRRLEQLRGLAGRGRCEAALMSDIVEEFAAAVALLEQALQWRGLELLEDAIAAFETLLATHPVRVDTWMSSLAKCKELERTAELVDSLPLAEADRAAALEQLRQLGDELRRGALLHSHCQAMDSRLSLIRQSDEASRPREIRRQWKPLQASLDKILPGWQATEIDGLRLAAEQLSAGIAASDAALANTAFDDFCDRFDRGFYTVDADFMSLCDRMKDQAKVSLAPPRETV